MRLEYEEKNNPDWDKVNPFFECLCVLSVLNDDFSEISRIEYLELKSEIRRNIALHEALMDVFKEHLNIEVSGGAAHDNLMSIVKRLRGGSGVSISV